jgi:hypothetical protein
MKRFKGALKVRWLLIGHWSSNTLMKAPLLDFN